MSRAEVRALREKWRELFGCEPPRCGSIILPGAVAWGQQVAEHGDISPALLRDFHAIAAGYRSGSKLVDNVVPPQADEPQPQGTTPALLATTRLVPGARLVKVYQGTTYVVDVVDGGFVWNGVHFTSLSGVAKAITGTHWNGLLFFGLRTRRAKPRHERGGNAPTSRATPQLSGKVVRHA